MDAVNEQRRASLALDQKSAEFKTFFIYMQHLSGRGDIHGSCTISDKADAILFDSCTHLCTYAYLLTGDLPETSATGTPDALPPPAPDQGILSHESDANQRSRPLRNRWDQPSPLPIASQTTLPTDDVPNDTSCDSCPACHPQYRHPPSLGTPPWRRGKKDKELTE